MTDVSQSNKSHFIFWEILFKMCAPTDRCSPGFNLQNPMKSKFAVVCLCFVVLSGCGGATVKRDPVFPVKGKVTYKGKPVVGADVTFAHEGGKRSAFGRTDSEGMYQLTTFGNNDGAIEGKHSVTIAKSVVGAPAEPEAPVDSEAYVPPGYGPPPKAQKPVDGIPAKYAKAETSGQIAVVNTDGENVMDFDLKD